MKPVIKFFDGSRRINTQRLDGVRVRFFYKELKLLVQKFEMRYSTKLSNESLLICVDGKEIYRSKKRLFSMGIETIQDIIDYLNIIDIDRIVSDNVIITDISGVLNNIYVLEIITRGAI